MPVAWSLALTIVDLPPPRHDARVLVGLGYWKDFVTEGRATLLPPPRTSDAPGLAHLWRMNHLPIVYREHYSHTCLATAVMSLPSAHAQS